MTNKKITELSERIRRLEDEIEHELGQRRAAFHADFEHHKIRFEQELLEFPPRFKVCRLRYIFSARLWVVLTAPIIYSVIIPLVLLDIFVSLYQWVCFPVYGIPKVKRRDYLVFDRAHLAYLNTIEKINCAYCSYGNGLVAYSREIFARTEQYWCPIKHARRILASHERYSAFADFGDAESYRQELARLREELHKLQS